jgi:hypothetical protein
MPFAQKLSWFNRTIDPTRNRGFCARKNSIGSRGQQPSRHRDAQGVALRLVMLLTRDRIRITT